MAETPFTSGEAKPSEHKHGQLGRPVSEHFRRAESCVKSQHMQQKSCAADSRSELFRCALMCEHLAACIVDEQP